MSRWIPRWWRLGLIGVATLGLAFALLQAMIELDANSNSCDLTPPGFENQRLVATERHLLWNECTLDPGNGDPRYKIRRPFEDVAGYPPTTGARLEGDPEPP